MKASDHQNLIERTHDVIWNVLVDEGMHSDPEALKDILNPRYILPYALIQRGMDDDELRGVVSVIRELTARVRSSGEFAELIVPDTIEIGIAACGNVLMPGYNALKKRIGDLVGAILPE